MNDNHRGYFIASAAVFAIVAALHAWRALAGTPIEIGGYALPVAASWIAAVGTAALAIWGLRASRG